MGCCGTINPWQSLVGNRRSLDRQISRLHRVQLKQCGLLESTRWHSRVLLPMPDSPVVPSTRDAMIGLNLLSLRGRKVSGQCCQRSCRFSLNLFSHDPLRIQNRSENCSSEQVVRMQFPTWEVRWKLLWPLVAMKSSPKLFNVTSTG